MHRVSSRSYVGQPNESVTLSNQPSNGGQVSATLDGSPISPNSQFSLPGSAGAQSKLQVLLSGPTGASTVVGISVVAEAPGQQDTDFLICQTHNPQPMHEYTMVVASASAVARFGAAKGVRAMKPAAKKPSAKKTGAKKAGAKKPGAKKPRRKGGSR